MDKKAKIRERYKGFDNDKQFVIPAKPQPSIYDDTVKTESCGLRSCFYG